MSNKKKILWSSVFLLILSIFSLSLVTYNYEDYLNYSIYLPIYDPNIYPPRVVLYSSMSPRYLIENAKKMRDEYGFDGFIINSSPADPWFSGYKQLDELKSLYKEANKECAKWGIEHNFLKVAVDRGIADWTDEKRWQEDLEKVRLTVAWAREVGFKGIAFDTETYNKKIFNNALTQNMIENLDQIIYQRANQVMTIILEEFPEAEFMVFPVGHLYAYDKKEPNKYYYWIDFYNGLVSTRPPQGITLITERAYKIASPQKIKDYYYDIQGEIMADHVEYPMYWLQECNIGFGVWPLGREYWDKRENLTATEFFTQLHTAAKYSSKYIFIYAHGHSWWQIEDGDKYGMRKDEAALPTVKNIESYKKMLLSLRNPDLKVFYRELKYNKKYSALNLLLENIF